MSDRWAFSDRWRRLPADWRERRRAVLERDNYTCQLRYAGCVITATEVDHIDTDDNHDRLQAACSPCHRRKSAREGAAARPRLRRPPEAHPAL